MPKKKQGEDLYYPLRNQRPTQQRAIADIGRLKECISDNETEVTHLFNIAELDT